MKVFFLNPPFKKRFSRSQRSPAVTKSGTLYYPIWLSYATGVLEKEGFNCRLVDAVASDYTPNDIKNIAMDLQPELVVLDTSTPSIYNDIEIAESIKEILPRSFIVLVGPHVSACPGQTLQLSDKIDAIAHREYDYTLLELASALKDRRDLKEVKGIAFRQNGTIVSTPDRPYIEDLDSLPFVSSIYKKHLNPRDYFNSPNLYPMVTIVTGRGCGYPCFYCLWPQVFLGNRYRWRSIENIMDEFDYIKKELPYIRQIMIDDDNFTSDRDRCLIFCEEILRRNLKIVWSANARPDVAPKTLKLMKRAGCRLLLVGFESANQDILENIKKSIRVENMEKFAQDAKKAGIMVHGCFMFGNPGETGETFLETLQFAKKAHLTTAQFFPLNVYPGTQAYAWAVREGYLTSKNYSDWLTEEGWYRCVISQPELTAQDLIKFCDRARREFYLRPAYFVSTLKMIFSPAELKRVLRALKIFLKHLIRRTR